MTSIIFDIDGTLTNTTKVDDKCYIKAFDIIFGIDISNQDWSELTNVTDWGITEEIILKCKNRAPTAAEYENLESEFVSQLLSELLSNESQFHEIKGASSFINFLREKTNVQIGIATGGWEKSANLKLKFIGIDSTEFAFSSSNHFKSREEIVLNTINKLNQRGRDKIDRVIYFGDGTWDYLTCKKLGIEFIGIDNLNNNRLREVGAITIYQDFGDYESIYNELGV